MSLIEFIMLVKTWMAHVPGLKGGTSLGLHVLTLRSANCVPDVETTSILEPSVEMAAFCGEKGRLVIPIYASSPESETLYVEMLLLPLFTA